MTTPQALTTEIFRAIEFLRQTEPGHAIAYQCLETLDGSGFAVLHHGIARASYSHEGFSYIHFARADLKTLRFYPSVQQAVDAYHDAHPKLNL